MKCASLLGAYMIMGILIFSCDQPQISRKKHFPKQLLPVQNLPSKENFWVFIMAGQSNMAGRAMVQPEDTIPNPRVIVLDSAFQWVLAKEPLHFYEPKLTGLDSGLSFGKALASQLPDSISIGIIPCAVGGSTIKKWAEDSIFRGVKLFSNVEQRMQWASKNGTVKGVLWHQGESDSKKQTFINYKTHLKQLLLHFRQASGNDSLPIYLGELGSFLGKHENTRYADSINTILTELVDHDQHMAIIPTQDLNHKGDYLHFNSVSERTLGRRYAAKVLEKELYGVTR